MSATATLTDRGRLRPAVEGAPRGEFDTPAERVPGGGLAGMHAVN